MRLEYLLLSADPTFLHRVASSSESNSCKNVHHKINPKHLDDVERQVSEGKSAYEASNEHGHTDSELENDEFSGVVKHCLAPFN